MNKRRLKMFVMILSNKVLTSHRPNGLTFTWWDVAVCVFDIDQRSLPTTFILFLCLFLTLWPFRLYFIPKILHRLSAFSRCSCGLIFASLILSTIFLLWKSRSALVNYGKKSCVALPAHPFIQPTILSLALADSHLALMGVHTLITSSDSHADIEEI